MPKRRLVVTVKEEYGMLDVLGSVQNSTCKSLYTSPYDVHAELHRYPLSERAKEANKDLYKERFYYTLGKQGKEWYRTYTIDTETDAALGEVIENQRQQGEFVDDYYEDGYIRFTAAPQDPLFIQQRPLFDKLFIEDAWDLAPKQGAGVLVAVLDTGVKPNHPDLAPNLWRQGPNIVGFPADGKNMDDQNGHGTAVCGIIGAASNNVGIIGIAPAVQLQVHMLTLGADKVFMSACSSSMLKARDTNCRIVNCSFTVDLPNSEESVKKFQASINSLSDKLLFVFSAGNDGISLSTRFLTGLKNVLITGALTNDDRRAGYSNFGSQVVYAYGDILSTNNSNGNGIFQETSAAAPQLTGICALMLSVQPSLSPVQIKTVIENTTDPLPFVPKSVGIGKVNAKRAIEKVIHDFGLA